jgi:phosphoribosylanthranilate isomerase
LIKALRIGHAADIRDSERFHTDFHLLDTAKAGAYGGTGETWDWGLLKQRRAKVPLILSGGLNSENVAEAIAAVKPWGVDVASGVEASPGVKDPAKLEAFFTAVDAVHVS